MEWLSDEMVKFHQKYCDGWHGQRQGSVLRCPNAESRLTEKFHARDAPLPIELIQRGRHPPQLGWQGGLGRFRRRLPEADNDLRLGRRHAFGRGKKLI